MTHSIDMLMLYHYMTHSIDMSWSTSPPDDWKSPLLDIYSSQRALGDSIKRYRSILTLRNG